MGDHTLGRVRRFDLTDMSPALVDLAAMAAVEGHRLVRNWIPPVTHRGGVLAPRPGPVPLFLPCGEIVLPPRHLDCVRRRQVRVYVVGSVKP